jgi:hypothetical protein
MGIRMMLFTDKKSAPAIMALASAFGIKAYIMGEAKKSDKRKVIIHTGDEGEPVVEYN